MGQEQEPADSGAQGNHTDAEEHDRVLRERDSRADDREAELDAREIRADAHEARIVDRAEETNEILAAADDRDGAAETRDHVADEREKAASLRSFVYHKQDNEYDAGLRARRAAAGDQSEAKTDRASGASNRTRLSDRHPKLSDPEGED